MERIWPVFTSMTTAVPLTALRGLDRLGQRLLGLVLELGVERELQPGARASRPTWSVTGDWGSATPAGDSMIVSLPSVPASSWLSPYSSPAAPCPAALVNPTTGRGQVAVGHHPLGVGDQRDAGEGVGRDLLPGRLGQLAGQHHVPGRPVQLGGQGRGRDMRACGDSAERRLHRMRDLEVVGDDVVGGDGERERRPVAGVDAAAQRGQRHRDGGLAARRRLVGAGVQDLDVDQAGHQEQHGHDEDQADQPHPAREGPALPTAPLARQREPGDLGRRAVRTLPRPRGRGRGGRAAGDGGLAAVPAGPDGRADRAG